MKRLFIETAAFSKIVKDGKITDKMLHNLQNDIIANKGTIIRNTGGLGKIRLATEKGGKSGGWRAIFADYPNLAITVLITAFPKNIQENITAKQAKQLKKLKEQIDKDMELRYVKEKNEKEKKQ